MKNINCFILLTWVSLFGIGIWFWYQMWMMGLLLPTLITTLIVILLIIYKIERSKKW